ncbi:N-acyl-D-amino-acid deacylase family protein [Pseudactinotalea sp. Z1748]|uniref:N-acyl-D-amino-acid deacylase family protein n=1 Tax=Pseudactinotalea sp. Z1748 TaxID=3413027 RepID=UPI003C7D4B1A
MVEERSVLFRNASVLDGTGRDAFTADVRVEGDTITDVRPGIVDDRAESYDLRGLTLTPGFIDMHSHSDIQILANPDHEAKLSQGVTLEVLGQDGLSYAPVSDEVLGELRKRIRGWNDDPDILHWDWRTVADYLRRLDGSAAVNTAYLVPHGTLRMLVMGDAARPATPDEVRQMAQLLHQGLTEGAVGLSAGLTYVPGMFATTDELVELCRVVAEHGGYFCPHHRNYGPQALEGYAECIDIAKQSGVALHFAHAHLSFDVNRGKLPGLLRLFDDAIAQGVDLSFDSYPYLAAMTTLSSQLPSWAQRGGIEDQIDRLRDPITREEIITALDITGSDGHQGLTINWSDIHVSSTPSAPEFEWVTAGDLRSVAAEAGRRPAELCLDILIATELGASCVMFVGIEEHVRTLMQHPRHMVGSDGILVGDRPHPRSWGTFPRILHTYVREDQVLSLPEAIRHMTYSPAQRLRLADRGQIASGYKADIVIFDPATIRAQATYERPRQPATGIEHVLVNGRFAMKNGKVTGTRTGRALRGAE